MRRRTHRRLERRSRRSSIILCWIAGLLPLLGLESSRVFYHCQITGELLPVCCCERADPPPSSSPEPPCCKGGDETQESQGDRLVEQDCDCCDVHYEEGRSGIRAIPESKTVGFDLSVCGPLPRVRPDAPRAVPSPFRVPSSREPPGPALYILFESFRS